MNPFKLIQPRKACSRTGQVSRLRLKDAAAMRFALGQTMAGEHDPSRSLELAMRWVSGR